MIDKAYVQNFGKGNLFEKRPQTECFSSRVGLFLSTLLESSFFVGSGSDLWKLFLSVKKKFYFGHLVELC